MIVGFTLATALALNGVLAGMTLDQSIKQLPARRKIGASAYSAYSRASDLGNGILLYAAFGIAAPVAALICAVAIDQAGIAGLARQLAWAGGATAPVQLGLTAFAAPTNFSQKRYDRADDVSLSRVFDRFEKIQTARSVVVVLAFLLLLVVATLLLP